MKKLLMLLVIGLVITKLDAQTQVPENSESPIYYNGDNVGIVTSDPEATLPILGSAWSGIKIQDATTLGGRGGDETIFRWE